MSSPKAKNQTVEGIAKPGRDTERCSIGRASRLPTHARSPSASGQKSKIPTNIGNSGRTTAMTQSQVQDNSRLLTSVASEEVAGGNSSPINTGRRLTSKSLIAASSPPSVPNPSKAKSSNLPTGNSSMQKRQLETQFATKKKRYATLKKELTDKQKSAVDLYEEMSQIREKLIASGSKDPGKIETINLSGIPAPNCQTQFPVSSHALRGSGEQVYAPNSDITSELVSSMESKLRELPDRCYDTCREALQKRSEILQWFEKFDRENSESKIDPEISLQLEIYRKESTDLETRLEETKKTEEAAITNAIEKLSALWNEVEVSRSRIRELELMSTEMMNELHSKVETALAEKKCETERCEQLQERKLALETEVRGLKTKIRGMETRANEDETKIAQLQSNVKNLESQLKQKECSVEQRLKEMQKSLKNGENLLAKTEKQRDTFETRLNELKKSYGSKETEAENKIKELSEQLEAANIELIQAMRKCETERLLEVTFKLEEETSKFQHEKDEILKVINSLFSDGISSTCSYLPHVILVETLTKKVQDFRSNFQRTQEKNENLQKQLTELQSHKQTQSKDSRGGKSVWSSEINELKRRNEELEIQLNQKQLEIENQDRAMREQSTVLNLRDEVIALVKGKPSSRGNSEDAHLAVAKKKNQRDREQVDKQIAEKAENLQQLYSTLEKKQMQISRLEQLVKQMEIQQDRSQEQRTRLEKRIAQLQLAMHYRGKSHRYVKTENAVSPPKVSSAPYREAIRDESSLCPPRSFSRPPAPRSPTSHHPQIQRSKTLNSFEIKSNVSPSNEYNRRMMDEVARTLKRERPYDYNKRGARDERKYSQDERGAGYVEENAVDPRGIARDEIYESFYNWVVEPWMFEGQPSNLILPTSDLRGKYCPRVRSPNSDVAVNVNNPEDRSPRRQRATNDCSRESRCGSPGCRRQSVPDWNSGSARITRVRTSPQNNSVTRSRLQRS